MVDGPELRGQTDHSNPFFIHQQKEDTMYTDCNGNHYQSYDHACVIHGGETAASLAAQDAWNEEQAINESLDAMEARGGPAYDCQPRPHWGYDPVLDADVPF